MTPSPEKSAAELSPAFIEGVRKTIAADKYLRRRMPEWGQVHIDRKQPFLCVYRRPPGGSDAGTDRLLLGQASHLLVESRPELLKPVQAMIFEILEELSDSFGGVLLLELWSEADRDDSSAATNPRFRIIAPLHDAPGPTIETLEASLLSYSWHGIAPDITIDYQDACAPPGLRPLISQTQAQELNCTVLGLGVTPFYRDTARNRVYPDVLTATRHALGHVLKQTFFTYAHVREMKRPTHYHELGREAMTQAVRETDRRLAELNGEYSLLLQATPVNADAAWHAFQDSGYKKTPEFHYRPRTMDPGRMKYELYRIPLENIEDPTLHHIFSEKRDEMDREITMISDRGTPRFLYGSQQVFGTVDSVLIDEANQILDKLPPQEGALSKKPPLDASAFVRFAENELAYYRQQHPDMTGSVEIRKDVPGIMVSHGKLLVGHASHVAHERINATIQHEVGTHMLTYCNGRDQPFAQLRTGMAGYEELQEGIAVLSEYLVGGLSTSRLRMLAGRVIAVAHLVQGADFIETYCSLSRDHGFSGPAAYSITMRVFRGGGFTKDIVYLRGLRKLLDYLADGGSFETLLVGKISLPYIEFIDELRWRKILTSGKLRPRYLEDEHSLARLEELKRDTAILSLVETGQQ